MAHHDKLANTTERRQEDHCLHKEEADNNMKRRKVGGDRPDAGPCPIDVHRYEQQVVNNDAQPKPQMQIIMNQQSPQPKQQHHEHQQMVVKSCTIWCWSLERMLLLLLISAAEQNYNGRYCGWPTAQLSMVRCTFIVASLDG